MIFARLFRWYGLSHFNEKFQPSPTELHEIRKNFQKYYWRDSHQKHLLTILKVLAERGKSTIGEIVESDGFSQEKKRKLNRHKIYSRVLEGSKDGKVKGLLPHQIVHVAEKIVTSKPIKKYELSYFGIFLAIHVFTRDEFSLTDYMDKITREKYDEYNKEFVSENLRFLNNLAKSYTHFLPLVFGKWDFIKNEFPDGINYLIKFAEDAYYEQDLIGYDDPFMNTKIIEDLHPEGSSFHFFPEHYDWSKGNYFQDEITMWFYTLLLRSNDLHLFQQNLRTNQEVYEWFNNHTNKVVLRQKELLSNSKNVKSWLQQEKANRINSLVQIALDELSFNGLKGKKKLSKLEREILNLKQVIEQNQIRNGSLIQTFNMKKHNELVKQLNPKLSKFRWKVIKKLSKIMGERWQLSKDHKIEYLTEIHYILESEHSESLFTITSEFDEIPADLPVEIPKENPILQIPPEELRRWIRRYDWKIF